MDKPIKTVVETEEILKGLKVVGTVINNSNVSGDNKYVNIVTYKSNIYFMGIGNQRLVIYLVGHLPQSLDYSLIYHIKYSQLAQPLSTLGSTVGESLSFAFDDGKIIVRTGERGLVKLNLVSYTTDDITPELNALINFDQGQQYLRDGYLDVLQTLGAMVQDPTASVILTNTGYAYTQEDSLMVSRLKYEFDKEHVLDLQSVKTILEILKATIDEMIFIDVDDEKELYTVRAGNGLYMLTGVSNYYPKEIVKLFDNFKAENSLRFDYKDFIKYLKLANIYLEDGEDAVLEYDGGLMSIIPGSAYEEDGLNRNETSYSDAKMATESTVENTTISIPLTKVLNTLGVLNDSGDVDKLVFELSDDETNAGHFKHDKGDMLLGINIIE